MQGSQRRHDCSVATFARSDRKPACAAPDILSLADRGGLSSWAASAWNFRWYCSMRRAPIRNGSVKPQEVAQGGPSILIDTACSVHGYQSDISRRLGYSAKPRLVSGRFGTRLKRGQEIRASRTVRKLGAPRRRHRPGSCGRGSTSKKGWKAKDYGLPGFVASDRPTGIGMDGPRAGPIFVRKRCMQTSPSGRDVLLRRARGIYIPGEFGIRAWKIVGFHGPRPVQNFSPNWPKSIGPADLS